MSASGTSKCGQHLYSIIWYGPWDLVYDVAEEIMRETEIVYFLLLFITQYKRKSPKISILDIIEIINILLFQSLYIIIYTLQTFHYYNQCSIFRGTMNCVGHSAEIPNYVAPLQPLTDLNSGNREFHRRCGLAHPEYAMDMRRKQSFTRDSNAQIAE